jgi:hypothetical protein
MSRILVPRDGTQQASNKVVEWDPIDDLNAIMEQILEWNEQHFKQAEKADKLLPLPQPPVRARTDARTNPIAQRATQLRSVPKRVYAVSIQNQITTTVP